MNSAGNRSRFRGKEANTRLHKKRFGGPRRSRGKQADDTDGTDFHGSINLRRSVTSVSSVCPLSSADRSYLEMTNTNMQLEAEKWIREVFLPKKYGQSFRQKNLTIQSRGQFKFDAVSDDNEIVAVISTSAGFTPGGKVATDELMKVRSAALWVLMLESTPQKRLLVLTDQSMIGVVKDERKRDRFPKEFEIVRVKLPPELAAKVEEPPKEPG